MSELVVLAVSPENDMFLIKNLRTVCAVLTTRTVQTAEATIWDYKTRQISPWISVPNFEFWKCLAESNFALFSAATVVDNSLVIGFDKIFNQPRIHGPRVWSETVVGQNSGPEFHKNPYYRKIYNKDRAEKFRQLTRPKNSGPNQYSYGPAVQVSLVITEPVYIISHDLYELFYESCSKK